MQIRKHTRRFIIIFLVLVICLIVFAVKLVLIQVFSSEHLAQLAQKQQSYFIELEPHRGGIFDRNLRPLAVNVSVHSVYANPRSMTGQDKQKAVDVLSKMLNINTAQLAQTLNKNKYFVWVKRKISGEDVKRIKDAKLKGVDFIKESKRYYPNGELASHIIGFADIDNKGLEGSELFYDSFLKGKPGRATILRDARQKELLSRYDFIAPQNGLEIVLTIDETIQYIAESALEKAYDKYNAKAATIIVMDVQTGEILALANRPTYDLGKASESPALNRTNRAVSFVYEPGSIFKIVAASAALEEEAFTEKDKIFCENGEYRVANHILHDHTPHATLTFKEVFKYSSNIGVTKIAQKLTPNVIYKYGKRFRFGEKTGIDLKGEVNGLLKHPAKWSKTTIGAIPIGHEVTATPLQLVCAISSIANGGLYMRPFVVKYIKNPQDEIVEAFTSQILDRTVSEDIARRVTDILVSVVEGGTAKKARIPGVLVAGKTGTAQKVIDGRYSHDHFYASFMGFAPADNPRVAAIVVFDDPRPQHFGGTVAAPVFKEVVEKTLKYLKTSGT